MVSVPNIQRVTVPKPVLFGEVPVPASYTTFEKAENPTKYYNVSAPFYLLPKNRTKK